MKTLELVQTVTKGVKELEGKKEKGLKVNQDLVKEVLTVTEEVVGEVISNNDSVTVLGVKFGSKEQKGREGIITLGSRAGEAYKTEDKIVPYAKIMPSKKAELTREK